MVAVSSSSQVELPLKVFDRREKVVNQGYILVKLPKSLRGELSGADILLRLREACVWTAPEAIVLTTIEGRNFLDEAGGCAWGRLMLIEHLFGAPALEEGGGYPSHVEIELLGNGQARLDLFNLTPLEWRILWEAITAELEWTPIGRREPQEI